MLRCRDNAKQENHDKACRIDFSYHFQLLLIGGVLCICCSSCPACEESLSELKKSDYPVSKVTRLSAVHVRTRGFPSPPYDGFGFVSFCFDSLKLNSALNSTVCSIRWSRLQKKDAIKDPSRRGFLFTVKTVRWNLVVCGGSIVGSGSVTRVTIL